MFLHISIVLFFYFTKLLLSSIMTGLLYFPRNLIIFNTKGINNWHEHKNFPH